MHFLFKRTYFERTDMFLFLIYVKVTKSGFFFLCFNVCGIIYCDIYSLQCGTKLIEVTESCQRQRSLQLQVAIMQIHAFKLILFN